MAPITSSKVTTDHDAIRHWAEERGAKPALALKSDGEPGSIRLEFPGSRDTSLRETNWDDWLRQLDKSKLALLYQQQTPDGELSRFYRIVPREKADQVERAVGGRGRSAVRRGSPRRGKDVRLRPTAEAKVPSYPGKALRSSAVNKQPKKRVAESRRRSQPGRAGPLVINFSHDLDFVMERTTVIAAQSDSDSMILRSDEDPPIPMPPGEDPPPPVQEPPDKPVIAPDSPVREPGPHEPRRL